MLQLLLPNVPKYSQKLTNAPTAPNTPECSKYSNCSKYSRMLKMLRYAQRCSKCSKMLHNTPTGLNMLQIAQRCSRLLKEAPDCSKMLQIAQICSRLLKDASKHSKNIPKCSQKRPKCPQACKGAPLPNPPTHPTTHHHRRQRSRKRRHWKGPAGPDCGAAAAPAADGRRTQTGGPPAACGTVRAAGRRTRWANWLGAALLWPSRLLSSLLSTGPPATQRNATQQGDTRSTRLGHPTERSITKSMLPLCSLIQRNATNATRLLASSEQQNLTIFNCTIK
jgi:hypothetical protein